jgi:hypothetical protein
VKSFCADVDTTSLKEYWSVLKEHCVFRVNARSEIQKAKTAKIIAKRRERVALLKLLS